MARAHKHCLAWDKAGCRAVGKVHRTAGRWWGWPLADQGPTPQVRRMEASMGMVMGGAAILAVVGFAWWLIRATEEVGNLAGYYDGQDDDNDVE